MTLAEKSARVRQARAGAPQSLGPDRRLAARGAGRSLDQPHALDRQRRSVDGDVRRRRGVPLQGHRRRRRARQREARHAGDHAARSDHRHPGLSRALVHQGRRRRAADRRRMARHARQAVALEGRHELRRDRRPLLRLSDLLRPRRRRRREAGAARRDRSDHQPHPRQQLPAGRRRRQADALGLVGAGPDLGRPGRNRACARCTSCRTCASRCT